MGLIGAVSDVFSFFTSIYDCLPTAVKMLLVATLGLFFLFGLFRFLGGD